MSEVHEGPVAPVDDEELKPADMPFAWQLRYHLEKHGAVIAHEHIQDGARMGHCGVEAGVVYTWAQLNVVRRDAVERLAVEILERFGPHHTFGDLVIPHKNAVEYVCVERCGNVAVRHVVVYEIGSDSLRQRWDVLVRKTNR